MNEEKSNPTAIILDTNFIVEMKDNFRRTVEALKENYEVFVTEVSINERIGQKYREIEKKYIEITNIQKSLAGYAKIKVYQNFEDKFNSAKTASQRAYSEVFGDKIILCGINSETMNIVLERAYKKIPPFSTDEKASDKGFKDTVLWLSVLEYFKSLQHDIDVIFISSDKGFINNAESLCSEFLSVTNKTLDFKDNSYYKTLLGEAPKIEIEAKNPRKELTDVEKKELREQISDTIGSICLIPVYSYFGDESFERTFSIGKVVEVEDMKSVFESLRELINNNIFEKDLSPKQVFQNVQEVANFHGIPIENLEETLKLYEKIKSKYNEYLHQFLLTACEIVNRNYENIEKFNNSSDDDDLPF